MSPPARRLGSRPTAVATVALAVLAIATSVGAAPAKAAVFARSAWWSRLNDNGADLSTAVPKPSVGGVAVAATPQGATTIAGVHFDLEPGETGPVLTLEVESSSQNATADGIVVLACLAGAGWSAGAAQPWPSAPPAACATEGGGGSVAGQRSTDRMTWTFPIAPLQLGTVVDVLLVPAAATGAVVPPFQLNFAPVGESALAVRSGAARSEPETLPKPPPSAPAPPPSAPVSPSSVSASSPPGLPPLGSFAPPAADASPPLPPPAAPAGGATFTPLLPADAQGLTATAPVRQVASPARVSRTVTRSIPWWARLLAVAQIAVALGIGWWLLRRRDDIDDADVPRGLGPFVALRTGEVPHL